MKKLFSKKNLSIALILTIVVAGALLVVVPSVHAATGDICPPPEKCGLPDAQANSNTVHNIMGIAFGIIGAFAFLNIVLSGFKYITAGGDSQKTSEAKNGIVFSLVGLIIAITAEALVAFVVKGA